MLSERHAPAGSPAEVVFVRGRLAVVGGAGLLVIQPLHHVAARLQVMEDIQYRPGGRQLVESRQVGHRHPPQVAPAVVLVHHRHAPAVLVEVQGALAVDMASAGLEPAFHHPDPVQLVAGVLRIEMSGLDQILVFHLGTAEPVVVVGDVDFPLAYQRPVEAVRRAVEHVRIVHGAQPVGAAAGGVVGEQRGAADAALSRVVGPGLAGFLRLVEGFAHQVRRAGHARWRLGQRLVVEQGVVQAGEAAALLVVLE
ncbi:hypothetical protein G039_0311085 [Pseudomonas aeruginosa VRFPA01]|nr:hypothetical protein G039_0311085 [Pseudomonas aeruginosa VRFPA01]